MRLVRMRIKNFRCYREEILINFDDITALVGKNDAGKSAIMDALDIFLNDSAPDKNDASKGGDAKDLTIICEFDSLPSQVIIDDAYPTSLKEEYLLNADGRLELHKNYSGHLITPKCASVSAYAIHPTNDTLKDLLQLKNADLKKKAKELNIDLKGVDQKVNAQIRASIRKHVKELQLKPALIPLNEENAKDIWIGLSKYLPAFALFKSDRPSTDQDPEAQDPLKAAVREAIKAKEKELGEITSFVEKEVKKIAEATLRKIQEMDPDLASQLNPQIGIKKWETLFNVSITSDEDIPINKRGSGVKRLILLNFFRAKAEQLARESGHHTVIYGIEEPETCQHPHNQRMILRTLCDLSIEFQVIISTHTPMLARCLPDKNLRFVNVKSNKKREILIGSKETNELFANSLGVLPDNNVKLFIGVEGKHDISFLQTISKVLVNEGIKVLDLEKLELDGEIIFFPLGGENLALWTTRLKGLNRPEFHLYDRDVSPPASAKYQKEVDEINKRPTCKARSTAKKEIENYLHKEAIINAYKTCGITINIPNNFDPFDDVPLSVAKLVHEASGSSKKWAELDDEEREQKEKRAKYILNKIAPKCMNKKLYTEIDPKKELLDWFKDIDDLFSLK